MKPRVTIFFAVLWMSSILIAMVPFGDLRAQSTIPVDDSNVWSEYVSNPLFGGPTNGVDRAYYPVVLKVGATYHVWYGDGTNTRHATSASPSFGGAVFPAPVITGMTENGYHPRVLHNVAGWDIGGSHYAGPFLMYYTNIAWTKVFVAHSTDGQSWTEIGVCTGVHTYGGNSSIYTLAVLHEGGTTWKAYADNGFGYVQYYTSTDGLNWTGVATDILGSPLQPWETSHNFSGEQVFKLDDYYVMFYGSGNRSSADNNGAIGMAVSTNGQTWVKSNANPTFSVTGAPAWRDDRTYTPYIIQDGLGWLMYFTGRSTIGGNYSVGYATNAGLFRLIEDAMIAAGSGDTVDIAAGTYTVPSVINLDKANLTIQGAGSASTIIQVSGTGYRFDISAPGITMQDMQIQKADKTGPQDIIWIHANNTSIKNNTIWGQFSLLPTIDSDVSRAMVISGGLTGLLIEGNTIYALRQPAYISGPTTGNITNNLVYGTKGWVLEGGAVTFSGNTWGEGLQSNVYDIAILSLVPPSAYTDIVAMSNANNVAVIEDQRVVPAVLSCVYVDAATSYSSDLGGRYHPYQTITPAITRVVTGGQVRVAAGTYNESVSVTKVMTLNGAGSDAAGTIITNIGGTAISLGAGADASHRVIVQNLRLTASSTGILVSSFNTVDNIVSLSNTAYGLQLNPLNDLIVTNSKFNLNGSAGLKLASTASATNVSFSSCEFNGNIFGWYSDASSSVEPTFENVNVENSTFNDNQNKGIYLERLSNAVFDSIIVQNSGTGYLLNHRAGIDLNLKWRLDYTNIQILNSTVSGCGTGDPNGAGLLVKARSTGSYAANPAALDNVVLTNLTVTGNGGGTYAAGIRIGESNNSFTGIDAGPTNVVISGSRIFGNSVHEVRNATIGTGAAIVKATCNWYGTAVPAEVATKISGEVEFLPFLTSASGPCDGIGPVVDITNDPDRSYMTVRAAIDAPTTLDGDVITVAAGVYTEGPQVVVNKNLTIVGADKLTTVLTPSANTGNSGDARGWFLVNPGITFNLSNVTLDGTGRLVFMGILNKGNGTVDNCRFMNIKYNESGPDYAGIGMSVRETPNINVNVTNCEFSGIGRIGVHYRGPHVTGTYSGNSYTGKGAGNWLDYGVEAGGAPLPEGGAQIVISNNTITNCKGVASVDGSTSAGILVTTYFGPGTRAAITGCFLNDNTDGIAVGYDASDASVVDASSNNLAGNTDLAIKSTAPLVNASANWFGSNSASVVASKVSANVDYTPWFNTGTDTQLGTPGFQPDLSNLWVDDSSPQVGTAGRIQEGVNLVSGSTINLAAGTYNERVVIDTSLTLQGAGETLTILDGTGLVGAGSGITINTGITNVAIKDLTVQNYTGTGPNSYAGIYGVGQNNSLMVQNVTLKDNVGGCGFYANGPVNGVTLDNLDVSGHPNTFGVARGIVIWNGLKENITITNCDVYNNNCCGIELQDGTASGVTMLNNNIHDNGDNGIGLMGLQGPGENLIKKNTLSNNGRFGIEVKNPNGSGATSGPGRIVVDSNTVSRTLPIGDLRDIAGIAAFRRSVGPGNVDVPVGVVIQNNNVSGYVQASVSDGFGIVAEGMSHTVTGNTVSGCDVGIQRQAGHLPYPGDGDQSNLADTYFGRGNSPMSCGINVSGNILSNTINTRDVGAGAGAGLVLNVNTAEIFCSIQSAIDDAQTLGGHVIQVSAGTYNELITIGKGLTLQGVGVGSSIIDVSSSPATGSALSITNTSGNVLVDGFTIKTGTNTNGIYESVMSSGSTVTVSHNRIEGFGPTAVGDNFGLIAGYGSLASLVFTNNVITNCGSNSILLERHVGPTDVSYNAFDRNSGDVSSDAYFNMNYGGANITSLQKVSHNTIDMGAGTVFDNSTRGAAISFASSYTPPGGIGGYTNIQITDNTIVNLKPYRRGIGLWNGSSGTGSDGNISTPLIARNTISGVTGNTGSFGIRLLGLVTDATIVNNKVDQVELSFQGRVWNGHVATGAHVNGNSFTNITSNLDWQGTTALDASGNWYGSNVADTVAAQVTASVDYTPWLNVGTDFGGDPTDGFQGDFSTLWVDDNSPQFGAAGRIQEGINLVSGSTVNVMPGTYREQVYINKPLTLMGVLGSDSTLVVPPLTTMSQPFIPFRLERPIIGVDSLGTNVVIDGFTVDGEGAGNVHDRMVGVQYFRSSGVVQNCTVKRIRPPAFSGAQAFIGILVNHEYPRNYTHSVEVGNDSVYDCGKGNIVVNAPGTSADVHNSVVMGQGPVGLGLAAQVGIQFGYEATGTIANNTISGFSYTGGGWSSSSILGIASGGVLQIHDNTIIDGQMAIDLEQYSGYPGACNANVYGNVTTASLAGTGGVNYYGSFASCLGTALTRPGGNRSLPQVSPFVTDEGGAAVKGDEPTATMSVSYAGNTFTSTTPGTGTGIYLLATDTSPLTVAGDSNQFNGYQVGVVTDKDPGASLTSTWRKNKFAGNQYGMYDLTGVLQDARENWWNHAGGPADPKSLPATPNYNNPGGLGDSVSAFVDYMPWYFDDGLTTLSQQRQYSVMGGWNIVSVPLTVSDRTKVGIFPSAASDAFGFSSGIGYVVRDTLQNSAGYWLKFTTPESVAIRGTWRSLDTVEVENGWNMIGTISDPTPSVMIRQEPPTIISSAFFGYHGGYAGADTLWPAKGYWVRASHPGILILSPAALRLNKEVSYPLHALDDASALTLTDVRNAKQTLCFSSDIMDEKDLEFFELPPPPPAGAFDARFSTNRMLETVKNGEERTIPIHVSSGEYPLTIRWEMKDQSVSAWLLIGTREVPLNGSSSITVTDSRVALALKLGGESSLPKEFALSQNYPNPFNPSTTIKYELPKDSRVSLKLFNMLGQEVAALVSEEQKAGYKSVEWNASSYASGVYFYRLDAGSFTSVKKLLLLR